MKYKFVTIVRNEPTIILRRKVQCTERYINLHLHDKLFTSIFTPKLTTTTAIVMMINLAMMKMEFGRRSSEFIALLIPLGSAMPRYTHYWALLTFNQKLYTDSYHSSDLPIELLSVRTYQVHENQSLFELSILRHSDNIKTAWICNLDSIVNISFFFQSHFLCYWDFKAAYYSIYASRFESMMAMWMLYIWCVNRCNVEWSIDAMLAVQRAFHEYTKTVKKYWICDFLRVAV